ncbi:MAG TPA: Rieske 2Fe-2S domain-containing protein [Solirubrobacteraceae bacterium]|nr:Rieske 2Fe-2S domain-containing protein [Solirubrobacteraceae bacterium]
MKLWRWLVALGTLLFGRRVRQEQAKQAQAEAKEPIVEQGPPERGAENLVLVLLGIACLFAIGFIVTYAMFSPGGIPNELLGVCMGMCFLFIAAALGVMAKRLVVTEELEDEYVEEHPQEQQEVVDIIHESGSRITRKRLLLGAGAATAGVVGLAAVTPALSLGPVWDTAPLDETEWRRGVRLVDEDDHPLTATGVVPGTFYTAFPEGADKEKIGSSLVVVRLDPHKLKLPAGRADWAPGGILAFSKICTHAGCAVSLYRKPTFPTTQPRRALVCPCHYSTFDPAEAAKPIFGPAGRELPQLPLMVDSRGHLRAGGNFSGPPGPSWWGVRSGDAKTT